MRKSVFLILLATAAMPALAAVQTEARDDRRAARAEHSERADNDKPQQAERPARSERSEPSQANVAVERTKRTEPSQTGVAVERTKRTEPAERLRVMRAEHPQNVQAPQKIDQSSNRGPSGDTVRAGDRTVRQSEPAINRDSKDSVTNWRARERRSGRATTPRIPATPPATTTPIAGNGAGGGSGTNWGVRTPDSGTTTTGARSGSWGGSDRDGHRWSGDWRRDGRYNWRHHRSRYSSLYRLGRYHDPFGYGYRRWSIGFNLWPSYYRNNFWLNDPWQYRLPPAYGPYRWVRYYDDALLVNIYDGQVADVIHNFFW